MGAEPAEDESKRKRLLLVGDVCGNLGKLYTQVESQQKRGVKFDAILCVGAFLPGEGDTDAAASFAEYVTGKKKVPTETFFIESRSAAMLQASPDGRDLAPGLHFLGGYGVKEVVGLRVAYLSGTYDHDAYTRPEVIGHTGTLPSFTGTAYTPHAVAELTKLGLAKESSSEAKATAGTLDLLLTSDWPAHIEEKLQQVDKPKDPNGKVLLWREISAPPIAELVGAIEPRYHVFAKADIFYQRPPFQTLGRGHVCRCIALGKVGSKGKERKWLHGLQLSPATAMPEVVLMQRPENTTPCPFPVAMEDKAVEESKEPEYVVVPNQVFLAGLPPNVDERRLEEALSHVGTVKKVQLFRVQESQSGAASLGKPPCRGQGVVTFETDEEAAAACELSELLECGGRKVHIRLNNKRVRDDDEEQQGSNKKGKGKGKGKGKKREAQIVVEPHAGCWFCLVNPQIEKHLIIATTNQVYVATARGPLYNGHVLILPVKHAPCAAACPPELQEAIEQHIEAVRAMHKQMGMETMVFERWIAMSQSQFNHMQVQAIPIDPKKAGKARETIQAASEKWLGGRSYKQIYSLKEIAANLNDDAETPYVYFEIPGDLTASGRKTEKYIYVGGQAQGGPRIPMNFGRQTACMLLGCEEKENWRDCQEEREDEERMTKKLRERFKAFQPKSTAKPK